MRSTDSPARDARAPLALSLRPVATVVLLATLVLLAAPAGANSVARAEEDAGEWRLARSEAGITVHLRDVPGSGIAEFKGEALVGAPVSAITALLRDSNRFKTWFPNTPESKLLSRDGDVSVQYSVMGTPWPLSDRDNVLRSVRSVDPSTGVVTIVVEADPDHHPEQPGRVRVRHARGRWVLVPRGPDATHVTFQMHLDPGGGIPDWMINARVVESPFEALTNMRETLAR